MYRPKQAFHLRWGSGKLELPGCLPLAPSGHGGAPGICPCSTRRVSTARCHWSQVGEAGEVADHTWFSARGRSPARQARPKPIPDKLRLSLRATPQRAEAIAILGGATSCHIADAIWTTAIQAVHLSKFHGNFAAIQDVSFQGPPTKPRRSWFRTGQVSPQS